MVTFGAKRIEARLALGNVPPGYILISLIAWFFSVFSQTLKE